MGEYTEQHDPYMRDSIRLIMYQIIEKHLEVVIPCIQWNLDRRWHFRSLGHISHLWKIVGDVSGFCGVEDGTLVLGSCAMEQSNVKDIFS